MPGIEGEGLGGFALRVTVNDSAERLSAPVGVFLHPNCRTARKQQSRRRPPTPDGFAFVPQ